MIEQRSRNCVLLKKLELAWSLTKECKENVLSECLQHLKDNADKAYLQGMNKNMKGKNISKL